MSFLNYSTFHSRLSIFGYEQQSPFVHIYKVKNSIQKLFFSLSKLAEQTKIHLSYDFEVLYIIKKKIFDGSRAGDFLVVMLGNGGGTTDQQFRIFINN
jgi:hypothetical protein